ncbi:uncharacterized protein TRIVIDRAFT_60272 [Trichoderma virens Gv29-8]|uniref:Uncharacterized protein n=1 Tax=Hypocrea virens (strain Gv29-8 / FGSC 10586) TaxID=413071 RepID=G9MS43_HYPVG|nr:uncharacterized protein TRIVIDRAFT_60272 [Trichoderma virens Gv29-8]EHK22910.1 hypothetical protein TRIVIDRAFT_60272 [Trichoderma virens Gv29-8]UKZ47960.1 hypothetical protein TrVGV298_002196 [Trichoderma virens]
MLLLPKIVTILSMVSLSFGAPATTELDDRSISKRWSVSKAYKVNKTKWGVDVVVGVIITEQLIQSFENAGIKLAQAVTANLVDQWNKAYGSGILSSLGYYNAQGLEHLYCTSIQSSIFFASQYNAQIFVTLMQSYLKSKGTNDKRDEIDVDEHYRNVTLSRRAGIEEIEERLGPRNAGVCCNCAQLNFVSLATTICHDATYSFVTTC